MNVRCNSGRSTSREWQHGSREARGISSDERNSAVYSSQLCSEPESDGDRVGGRPMYEIVAGIQSGGDRATKYYDASRQDDKRSLSSTSSGVKRPASPDFLTSHKILQRRIDAPTLRARASERRCRTAPSAWVPNADGQLYRYSVSQDDKVKTPADSGYASRQATMQTTVSKPPPVCDLLTEPALEQTASKQEIKQELEQDTQREYLHFSSAPGQTESTMLKQLPRSFITQEQLAAEVKGIYAGLVMVEAKSINIDAEQAADRNRKLTPEQWQSLIALRRTLLYEHHDFLMATQHPTANAALRGLAAKYCMPARMWKHGIHGFLEVLRHRRPESQEYMLTFIYLAYDMMALLFETVPAFTDTWIECLGDLARYRMAIEENKEVHAIWGGVAGRWYTMASDRHPQIGRLYHHLGILERPSLRKLYFYSRSLTSVVPFINARESLGTLCAPILQDDQAIRCGPHGAEAMTICYHARVFSNLNAELLERDGTEALQLLVDQPAGKIASYATPLAVTNIAALFEFGMPNNILRQMFSAELARAAHNARPSTITPVAMSEAARAVTESEAFVMTTTPSDFVVNFTAECFNKLIRRELDHGTVRDLLQYVHVNLVFFSALIDLKTGLTLAAHIQMVDKVLKAIDWKVLADFLNGLAAIDPISRRVEQYAAKKQFLMPEKPDERKPLAEDFMIRGIIWAEGYVAALLFDNIEDDDGSRGLETPARLHLRAERVEWLACCIAQSELAPLQYDAESKHFTAQQWEISSSVAEDEAQPQTCSDVAKVSPDSSVTMSRQSSMVDDFDMVSMGSLDHKLDVRSLRSSDGRPTRTDGSYVSVSSNPPRALDQRSHKKAKRHMGALNDVEIRSLETADSDERPVLTYQE